MDMFGLMANPQRTQLMERVGVIPYLNDRQERIKRECWWTRWYRWVMLWFWSRDPTWGQRGMGWSWCEFGVEWAGGRSLGSDLALSTWLPSIMRTNTRQTLSGYYFSSYSSNCNIIHRSLLVLTRHSTTYLHQISSSCSPARSYRTPSPLGLLGLCQPQ